MFNILTTSIIMLSILIYLGNRPGLLLTTAFLLLPIMNPLACYLCSSSPLRFFYLFKSRQLSAIPLILTHLGRSSGQELQSLVLHSILSQAPFSLLIFDTFLGFLLHVFQEYLEVVRDQKDQYFIRRENR